MAEKYLTPEQVAERLSVSPKSVRKWLRADKLKGHRVGRQWRVQEDELKRFLFGEEQPRPKVSAADLMGILAGSSRTVDDFLREKHEENEREERRWEEMHKG